MLAILLELGMLLARITTLLAKEQRFQQIFLIPSFKPTAFSAKLIEWLFWRGYL